MKDLLSDILDTVRLRATLYFRTDFSEPWAVTVPVHPHTARFHLVIQGNCHISLPSGQSFDLGPDDLIIIPHGQEHKLADRADREPAPLEKVIADSGYTGRGAFVLGEGDPNARTQMVCGHFGFNAGSDHPFLRALPDAIVINASDRASNPFLNDILQLVARRAFGDPHGAAATISRLSEVLFTETIRLAVQRHPELAVILGGVADDHIMQALELMHANPGRPWSVDMLAEAVGMSRSRFSERFHDLIGSAPINYLIELRMQKAASELTSTPATVKAIANRVGYHSPAAFSRAFTTRYGRSPRELRADSKA
ncbi:MAG: cupin domain-containing protein [Alphaproteobacteria bacterium]